jgi:hypothetical protein
VLMSVGKSRQSHKCTAKAEGKPQQQRQECLWSRDGQYREISFKRQSQTRPHQCVWQESSS